MQRRFRGCSGFSAAQRDNQGAGIRDQAQRKMRLARFGQTPGLAEWGGLRVANQRANGLHRVGTDVEQRPNRGIWFENRRRGAPWCARTRSQIRETYRISRQTPRLPVRSVDGPSKPGPYGDTGMCSFC